MSSFELPKEETKSTVAANNAGTFFKDEFSPPSGQLLDAFSKSVEQCTEGMKTNAYLHYKGDPFSHPECVHWRKSPWSNNCHDCKVPLDQKRLNDEKIFAGKLQEKDRKNTLVQPHNHRIHALGIRADALVAFAFSHDCWDWTTKRVVRDIIVPATRGTRCRYGELSETSKYFAPATVFASHCWGARFGDLVGAVCQGAKRDRFIWIDIFAVRQWPGNHDDFEFRSILCRCEAMILSISTAHGLTKPLQSDAQQFQAVKKYGILFCSCFILLLVLQCQLLGFVFFQDVSQIYYFVALALCILVLNFIFYVWVLAEPGTCCMCCKLKEGCGSRMCQCCVFRFTCLDQDYQENNGPLMQYILSIVTATRSQWLLSDEGKKCKPAITTCRLWCYQEIAGAVDYEIPIVVKCGKIVKIIDGIFQYNQEGSEIMLDNLQYMVDAESSECTNPEDKVREMKIIREMVGGVEHVNNVVAGVIAGALQSINLSINEVDAAVCGEMEALIDMIERSWSKDDQKKVASCALIAASSAGRTQLVRFLIDTFLSHLQREETKDQNNWLSDLINISLVVPITANGAHIDVFKMLLYIEGVDINVANSRGQTSLWLASEKGHNEVVRILLGLDEDDNSSFSIDNGFGNLDTLLIADSHSNVDPNQYDQNGKSPLWIARELKKLNIVDLLLQHPNIDRCTCCSYAIKKPSKGFKILILLGLACLVVFIAVYLKWVTFVGDHWLCRGNCTKWNEEKRLQYSNFYTMVSEGVLLFFTLLSVVCWMATDMYQKCSNGMGFYDEKQGKIPNSTFLFCIFTPLSIIVIILVKAVATDINIVFTCHDIVPWVDKDGDGCTLYEANGNYRCQTQGTNNGSDSITANRACCACGGGINIYKDVSCQNVVPWVDKTGRRCTAYGAYSRCANNGSDGIAASSACCACPGGGIKI